MEKKGYEQGVGQKAHATKIEAGDPRGEPEHYQIIIEDLKNQLTRNSIHLEETKKELETLAYSVSHDLKSPLRHIQSFLNLLHKNDASRLSDKGRRYIDIILKATNKMNAMFEVLLEYSRLGRSEMQPINFDMDLLLQEKLEFHKSKNPRRDIRCVIHKLPSVWGDPKMIGAVWSNLLENAIKFTSLQKETRIEIGGNSGESENVFFVKDNGTGFNLNNARDKIFGVFQRFHADEEFEGLGTGLAVVRLLVSKHGGNAWAHSEPGKGSEFYFTLPKKK